MKRKFNALLCKVPRLFPRIWEFNPERSRFVKKVNSYALRCVMKRASLIQQNEKPCSALTRKIQSVPREREGGVSRGRGMVVQ